MARKDAKKLMTKTTTFTVNAEQGLFVIPCGTGYSCLGFDVVIRRGIAILKWLGKDCTDSAVNSLRSRGTLESYQAYLDIMERAETYCRQRGVRCPVELEPKLIGLEGKRVEVSGDAEGLRRFYVGKSTGWMPCHLEIKTRRSTGGGQVYLGDGAQVRVIPGKR